MRRSQQNCDDTQRSSSTRIASNCGGSHWTPVAGVLHFDSGQGSFAFFKDCGGTTSECLVGMGKLYSRLEKNARLLGQRRHEISENAGFKALSRRKRIVDLYSIRLGRLLKCFMNNEIMHNALGSEIEAVKRDVLRAIP